jgi:hypothetical protein
MRLKTFLQTTNANRIILVKNNLSVFYNFTNSLPRSFAVLLTIKIIQT